MQTPSTLHSLSLTVQLLQAIQLERNVKSVHSNEAWKLKLHCKKQWKGKQTMTLFMGIREAENFSI